MARYVVGKVDDIADGDHIVVEINGKSVGIFHLEGEFYGLLNYCPHRGGPMCSGQVVSWLDSDRPGDLRLDSSRKLLECPWHGWEFDIKTGQSYFDPRRTRIRPFPVAVEAGEEVAEALAAGEDSDTHLVPGPYTAETIPVSVEDDYVVVMMR
ncbi:MAG TPA: Rieske (2Fe-2S) protein [Solirubrobacteraceae bacterium]|jgi:nitrite reductase/ring-hydroxylating ferredoxin subunit|nr:Rieske (2Fe-2S) protein [Solirubrobacteraceae bacterium]